MSQYTKELFMYGLSVLSVVVLFVAWLSDRLDLETKRQEFRRQQLKGGGAKNQDVLFYETIVIQVKNVSNSK